MKAHRTVALAAAIAVLGLAAPRPSTAQMRTNFVHRTFSLTMRAGPTMPVDQLAPARATSSSLTRMIPSSSWQTPAQSRSPLP